MLRTHTHKSLVVIFSSTMLVARFPVPSIGVTLNEPYGQQKHYRHPQLLTMTTMIFVKVFFSVLFIFRGARLLFYIAHTHTSSLSLFINDHYLFIVVTSSTTQACEESEKKALIILLDYCGSKTKQCYVWEEGSKENFYFLVVNKSFLFSSLLALLLCIEFL